MVGLKNVPTLGTADLENIKMIMDTFTLHIFEETKNSMTLKNKLNMNS